MNPADLELLVIEVAERALRRQPVDDPRVMLKRSWPRDFGEAGRELAGCANAARGELVLWVIGVDEAAATAQACDIKGLASWLDSVRARFDGGAAPTLDQALEVVAAGTPVVGLLFSTQRAPYVVISADAGGPARHEVPWRDAKGSRPATREDLLQMLVPVARLPAASVQRGFLTHCWSPKEVPWMLWLDAYLVPPGGERAILPHHLCWAQVSQGAYELWRAPAFSAPHELSQTVHKGSTELILDGPGLARFNAMYEDQAGGYDPDLPINVTVYAQPIGADTWLVLSATLNPQPALSSEEQLGWALEPRLPWEQ